MQDQNVLGGVLGTDQYQLTMAQLYWKKGLADRHVQFDHFFRDYPDYGTHQAGYCIGAGLGWLLDWMEEARFTRDDLDALRIQRTSAGEPRFDEGFLSWLSEAGNLSALEVTAVPEGRVVHANVPLGRGRGPAGDGPDPRDAAAQSAELPDPDRHQGIEGQGGGQRRDGHRVRPPPGSGGRGKRGNSGGSDRGL